MSLPKDTERDPRADALLTSALRAAEGAEAVGCPDAEVIGLYAERALAGAELRAVASHVESCPRCQATVAAFVRALPDAAEAAGEVSGATETSTGGGFAAWFAGWRWLVPATSLAAAALVAVWVGRGPADQVAESARGPAAAVDTDAAAPAAQSGLAGQPEAFVRPAPAGDGVPNQSLERAMPQRAPAAAVPQAAEGSSARGATSLDAETRAKAAPPGEVRQRAVGQVADSVAANESARVVSPEARAGAAGAARESATAAAAPTPAAAPAQETLTVSPAPPAAPAGRAAAFSALAFTPWRAVDGRVERSRDNGATWERVPTPDGVRVIAAGSPGGDVCWIVADGGVLRTTDGRTWTRTTRPTSDPLAGVIPVSAERASVFTAGGARWDTTDGGRTWVAAR